MYALFVITLLLLIGCDTLPTHPNNDVHRMHSAINERHQLLPYPELDSNPPFFSEHESEDEKIVAYLIADEVMYTVDRNYDEDRNVASRDAHPKEHGCVRAEFHMYQHLDPNLAKGVFAKGQAYDTLIRFSNSSENQNGNDHENDARGMAIKLTNRLQPNKERNKAATRTMNQDFVMINHPVFILDDPSDYLSLVQAQNSASTLGKLFNLPFALGFRGMWNAYHTINQDQVMNPLETQYFSMVPYRLGKKEDPKRRAIKFSVRPIPEHAENAPGLALSCSKVETADPDKNDNNYLRTALFKTLEKGSVCMEFLIQEGEETMSVENSQIEWDSPFTPVALIKIPRMNPDQEDFDGIKKVDKSCEDESFDPWNALEEHRPLGVVNRLRKVIYPMVSEYRHCLNDQEREGCPGKNDSE